MIVDGTNKVLGRLASFAAKKALEGEEIVILNCENIVVSSSKDFLLSHYKQKQERGHPYHGPFFPKLPDRIVRRTIRGMLPYKKERGRKAFKKVKCYLGIPIDYQSRKPENVKLSDVTKYKTLDYLKLKEISEHLGKK
ncbi:MAG TPA: 50S ribosomal protein L13 [Candidatus Nanoarchaeia archaeon]|nr:50S ribosomal protein L13 [Candidatus Nanoarchaeia archaeon]